MRDVKREILHFWFQETSPQQWFQVNEDFDSLVKDRFAVIYQMAQEGLCDIWADEADGALALCIILDQFPRNMFRGKPAAFHTDEKAREIARLSLRRGYDKIVPPFKRAFFYLPFEHSESIDDQNLSVSLFEAMKNDNPVGYEYALRHRDAILRFGRFPHRNVIVGRASTDEEKEYLSQPGAGF